MSTPHAIFEPHRCKGHRVFWITALVHHLIRARGLLRSLLTYRVAPRRARKMRALYSDFFGAGDLVFDIGAHVGDRVAAFRSLGALVVAVEPQPDAMAILHRLHGGDPHVTLIEAAVGAQPGHATLHLNTANPTVSTLSNDLIAAAADAALWRTQRWDRSITVDMLTLDDLVAVHGRPVFVKIDAEGYEAEILEGLSTPLPALSFEVTTIQKSVAFAAIDSLEKLAPYRYNFAPGETQRFSLLTPVDAATMRAAIAALPESANSGDIYARLARS